MRKPTAEEQLILELINRLRMDPEGEYARLTTPEVLAEIQGALNFFGVDLSSFEAAMNSITAVAPLAWNDNLATAASGHNAAMIAADTQSHQLPGEPGLGQRANNAGYTGWSNLGENVYAFSNSIIYGHAGFVIDWGFDDVDFDENGQRFSNWQSLGDGIQDPAGHLLSIVSANFTEVGIAVDVENDPNTDVGPYVITHDFGNRFAYNAQFLGVVIDDTDDDDFYDIGEGMGGVTVTLEGVSGTFTTTTWDSGGWQIEVPVGTYEITFSGGGLDGNIVVSATIGAANVKVDVEAEDAVPTTTIWDGTPGIDLLEGGSGMDVLNGFASNDQLFGFGDNDILDGGAGDDELHGGLGDDVYIVDSAADTVTEHAGEGFDRIISSFDFRLLPTTFANVEAAQLSGSATQLLGNQFDNELVGNTAQGSVLVGFGGNDVLIGGDGNDTLQGSSGSDDMSGGAGNDAYFVNEAGDAVTELADEGTDEVRSSIDYTLGDNVEGLRLAGAATTGTGNALDNTMFGGRESSTLSGLGGDDTIYGSGKGDFLFGGDDNDTLFGNSGEDVLNGGDGDDLLNGGVNNDTLNGDGGDDLLRGGTGDDILNGGTGRDMLRGEGQNDTLNGGAENDTLVGGAGLDTLIGGTGRDTMSGDTGRDTFVFADGDFSGISANTADRITDFNAAQGELIDLTAVDAILGGGDDAFTFIADAAFTGTAGELRYENVDGNTMVFMDVDGDGAADYAIRLDGNIDLLETNFIL